MPNKHFYFAMGATTGVAISWMIRKSRFWLLKNTRWMNRLYRWNRDWFLYFPAIVLFFGLFAWIPDIFHALGIFPKKTTRSDFFDIFFFHSYFEKIEDQNPILNQILNWVGEFLLFSIAVGVLLFYVKILKKTKKNTKNQ